TGRRPVVSRRRRPAREDEAAPGGRPRAVLGSSVDLRNGIRGAPDARRHALADTLVMSRPESKRCTLRLVAQSRVETCPRERCAFWEPGGAVVAGGCLIERLAVDVRRPDVAGYLLETRERLEQAGNLSEAEAAHREFSRRLRLEL